MSYRDWLGKTVPRWLAGRWGSRFVHLVGLSADAVAEAVSQATAARFIDSAPDDAVFELGKDRGLPLGLFEGLPAYRERVRNAWQSWQLAGTEAGILAQVRAWLSSTAITLHTPRDWIVGDPADWSRFWLVIEPPHHWSPWAFGTKRFGGGVTFGSTARSTEVGALRALVRQWKAAHERCPYVIVRMSGGTIFGTGAQFGAFTFGGSVAARWSVDRE